MTKLNIITVWYNEEINLPKLFKSLEYIKSKIEIRHIYVDQSSIDNSTNIAKENWCEIYVHENKWYADPDKKWIVENLLNNEDWCLILDCDEEITKELSDEIIININNNKFDIFNIYIESIIFWWFGSKSYWYRLFKKSWVKLTNEIHNYINLISNKIWYLKNNILNNDLKYLWNEIKVLTEKMNRYSSIEIEKIWNIWKHKIIFFIFWKPIQRFFGLIVKSVWLK